MTTLVGTWRVRELRRLSFLRGAAAVMDLRGNTLRQYRFGSRPAKVDLDAIAADWRRVGDDLRAAVREYEHSGR